MPTYQYQCDDCGAPLEVVQSFSDEALTNCPACGANSLRKVYGSVGVVFKGSGFYRTDSRSSGSSTTPSSTTSTSTTTPTSTSSTSTTTSTTSSTPKSSS